MNAQPRTPKPVSPERLEKAALHYLERYASSSANLRSVLWRKVKRAALHHETDEAAAADWIEAIVAKLLRLEVLDDEAYTGMKVRSLRGRGNSGRMIRQKLAAKGVSAGLVDNALEGTTDLEAARNYVKRRRLGPWRMAEKREAMLEKDMAALARAGFSYDTARKALGGE